MPRHIDALRHVFESTYAKKVAFRPFSRADGFPLFEATRHPDFNRNLLWAAPDTEHEIFQQVDKLIREHTLGRALVFSVSDRPTGTWQGLLRVKDYEDGVELSLYLHPDTWHRGFVVTVGSATIELIFRHHPKIPVYLRVMPTNERMLKVCELNNFEHIRNETDFHPQQGEKELKVWRLTKERWAGFNHLVDY